MVRGLGDSWSYWQRTLCCIVCKAIENQGFPHTILPKCSLVQALLTNPHNALYESGLPCLASVGCPCSGPTCTTTWQLCSSLPNQTKNTVKMKLRVKKQEESMGLKQKCNPLSELLGLPIYCQSAIPAAHIAGGIFYFTLHSHFLVQCQAFEFSQN